MKGFFIIIGILYFFSCKSHSHEVHQTSIGDALIQNIDFINSIEKECSKDYINTCPLNKLKFNYHKLENPLIYEGEALKVFIKSDSVKNRYNTYDYRSHLFMQKIENKADSLLIYNEINGEFSVNKTFFYIKNDTVFLLKVDIDDGGVEVVDWKKVLIDYNSNNFKILEQKAKYIKKENSNQDEYKSLEGFKKEFVSKNHIISNELNIDFNSDGLIDKILIIRNKENSDCSNEKNEGENSILILEKTDQKRLYKLMIFSTEILPSDCSFGLAEPDLDIYFNDKILHFKGLYLSNDHQIYSRDFYFDDKLNLEKVILSHSIIGNELNDERLIINKNLIGNVNIKDFKYINFLEDRWQ